jgi:hypothetical protein
MRQAGPITYMRERRNALRALVGKSSRTIHSEETDVGRWIILKWTLKK